MALKAAEAHALRRAFDVSGLPAIDEQRPASTHEETGGLAAALAEDKPETDEPTDAELMDDDPALIEDAFPEIQA
jgi:hypothetical protein